MNGLAEYTEPKLKMERGERRAKLEKEREEVRSQLSDLRTRLPQLQRGGGPSKGPSKQGGVSKKRPAGYADLSGSAKRPKVEAERAKRLNSIWQQCHTILKTLLKSKDAFAFSKPVNPVTAKCPDYHDIIKRPMDLGTIQKKFPGKGRANDRRPESREYKNPYEFRDDVRLVWNNCRTYNAVGHAVRTMGDTLSEIWEKKWALSGIEAKWEEEMRRQDLEEQELAGGTNLAQQIQALDDALQQKIRHTETQPGYLAPQEGSAMNFEQKRRLSIALGQLPGDKVSEVMRIIAEDEDMRQKVDANEEVEVDIDQLSTDVLWKLDRYANAVLQTIRKKAGHKPEVLAATTAVENGKDNKLPNGGSGTVPADHHSSISPSSDSDTDASHSGSEGEVGSKDLGASQQSGQGGTATSHPGLIGGGNDTATLVSATRPPGQPQIVKNLASKKEVNLQNANAWADLGNIPPEAPAKAGSEDEGEDNLWDEFKSREQEEEQREKEKRAQEEQQQKEQQRAEEGARAEAQRLRREAEDAQRARREEEEARIKAQREREMEEMQNAGRGADFGAGAVELMDSKRQGDTLTDVLGLQRKESDSEDDSEPDAPAEEREMEEI